MKLCRAFFLFIDQHDNYVKKSIKFNKNCVILNRQIKENYTF